MTTSLVNLTIFDQMRKNSKFYYLKARPLWWLASCKTALQEWQAWKLFWYFFINHSFIHLLIGYVNVQPQQLCFFRGFCFPLTHHCFILLKRDILMDFHSSIIWWMKSASNNKKIHVISTNYSVVICIFRHVHFITKL